MDARWRVYGMLKGYNIPDNSTKIIESVFAVPVQELREAVIEYLIIMKNSVEAKNEVAVSLLGTETAVAKIKPGQRVRVTSKDCLNGIVGSFKKDYGKIIEISILEPIEQRGKALFIPLNTGYEIAAL